MTQLTFCLQNYEKACDAFLDGLKLDPTNVEIEKALRYPTLLCVFEVQTSFWFPLHVIIVPSIILYCNKELKLLILFVRNVSPRSLSHDGIS